MKKIVSVLLLLVLVIAVSSCAQNNDVTTEPLDDNKKESSEKKEEVKGTIDIDLNSIPEANGFDPQNNTEVKGQTTENAAKFSMKDFFDAIHSDGDGEFYSVPVFFYGEKVTHTNGIFVISDESTKALKEPKVPDTITVYFIYQNSKEELRKIPAEVKVKLYTSNNEYLMSTQVENPQTVYLIEKGVEQLSEFVLINK